MFYFMARQKLSNVLIYLLLKKIYHKLKQMNKFPNKYM